MRIAITAALCALLLPASAPAKGPTEATITGPGLAKPLHLGGDARALAPGQPMDVLAAAGGFYALAWRAQPNRILVERPTNRLGPRYRVVYLVPGPSGQDDRIRQDLYPFARGGPVAYMPGGQRFFDTQRTPSGWFRAQPRLTRMLVGVGLPQPEPKPATPVAESGGEGNPVPWAAVLLVVAALAVTGIAVARRRPRPVSA